MFSHLHTHSSFSFLDGASRLEDIVAQAAVQGMKALAITDHDNLCAAVKFHDLATRAGIKPIQGVEVTVEGGYHLILIAEGPSGYRSLCRLLTRAHLDNPRLNPVTSIENLYQNHRGLIALSGCRQGRVPSLILARRYSEAQKATREYQKLFGPENFFLELQDTCLPGNRQLNARLSELALTQGLETVATNNVHYATPQGFKLHDVLTCVRALKPLSEAGSHRPLNSENYLKDPAEMVELFAAYPQAIANTARIAERCEPALSLGKFHFPAYELPADQTAVSRLSQLTYEGAYRRYGEVNHALTERIEHELNIIHQLGYDDYFLVVWDLVRFAHQERIRCAGRGSAADSVVAYCLGITEVDAWQRGLLFERFMSLERGEMPDIDIDFDSRYRDKAAAYLYNRYGVDQVASVATYNTFQARSALRDLGKALGIAEAEIDLLAKKLPPVGADRLREMMLKLPELRRSNLDAKRFELLLELCEQVADFPRFLGTHLGGLVVSREPLTNFTPLQQAAKGVVITQFDKDDAELLGLIKLDLLSLRTMSAIDDALIMINRPSRPGLDYDQIPRDDEATYEMLRNGETIGVFQLESPAQRALQSRLEANNQEDLVASVAIIRPGPIKGNMLEPFIARRQGREEVNYLHPDLKPILSKTYGVILFQEQVIEIARTMAGFTPGEADQLRRVMSHARSGKKMAEIGLEFVKRAVARGIKPEIAEQIFAQMAGYASYGFCEAHAAAFADISYKTAYLLRHYPDEFYAALLNHQPLGYYPPRIIAAEARRRGIKILPPRVEISEENYQVEAQGIRIPLTRIKGLSLKAVHRIIATRPFNGVEDFYTRTDLDRDELESLIKAGALDGFDHNRRRLLLLLARGAGREQIPEQATLEALLVIPPSIAKREIVDFGGQEKREMEMELLGMELGEHLMQELRPWCRRQGIKSSQEVRGVNHGERVKTAGVLLRPHRPPTRSGKIVVFMSLEDEYGLTDVTVFEDNYQRYGQLIFTPRPGILIVEGTVQRRGRGVSVIASHISKRK